MKLLTSWDDGHELDLKVADLLVKYKLPGIFFIPTTRCQMDSADIKGLVARGFEIGGHTHSHPADMKLLPREEQCEEILRNKLFLEDITGKPVEWFAYPRGKYGIETIDVVKSLGFKYARTTMVGYTVEPSENYRYHTTVHPCRKRAEYSEWLPYAIQKYEEAKERGYFHLWGHGWEIEEQGLWGELEEFLKYIYEDQSNQRLDTEREAE